MCEISSPPASSSSPAPGSAKKLSGALPGTSSAAMPRQYWFSLLTPPALALLAVCSCPVAIPRSLLFLVPVPVAVVLVVGCLAAGHEGKDLPPSMTVPTVEELSESADDKDGECIWREEVGKSVWVKKFYEPKQRKGKTYRSDITMSEVATHNTKSDCWVVIESRAYDISKYVMLHPGGWLPLQNMAGKDATDAFANYHPHAVYKNLLPSYYVGAVTDSLDSDPFTVAHRELRQQLLQRGLFESNSFYFYLKVIWLSYLLLGAVALTLLSTTTSSRMLGAAAMAAFWQQVAFIGHDVGHNAVSHKKRKDTFLGILFGNTLGGISLGWWKRSHNVHHLVCNSVEHDPDIQHMPLFAVTDEIFDEAKLERAGVLDKEQKGFWSTYHEKFVASDFLSRLLVANQHFLFYPIMMFARFNLYVQGWIFVFTSHSQDAWHAKHFQKLELATLFGFMTWLSLLVSTLPNWQERAAWLLISHALAGVLHVQICISHFTMDTYHGHAYNGAEDEWFRMQCATTMNVASWRWFDWAHGGLQFQIEHHLFPRLPRHNLREARALVKPFCERWGVPYHEVGFVQSNVELVRGLRDVARKCRQYGLKSVGGFGETQLYAGLHAEG